MQGVVSTALLFLAIVHLMGDFGINYHAIDGFQLAFVWLCVWAFVKEEK